MNDKVPNHVSKMHEMISGSNCDYINTMVREVYAGDHRVHCYTNPGVMSFRTLITSLAYNEITVERDVQKHIDMSVSIKWYKTTEEDDVNNKYALDFIGVYKRSGMLYTQDDTNGDMFLFLVYHTSYNNRTLPYGVGNSSLNAMTFVMVSKSMQEFMYVKVWNPSDGKLFAFRHQPDVKCQPLGYSDTLLSFSMVKEALERQV